MQQAWVWAKRICHCRGFGIQSPTDYRFVRYVINEHWPYYAYETIGKNDKWEKRKLGKLYFRLANHLTPATIINMVGAEEYLRAALPKVKLLSGDNTDEKEKVELALVPIQINYQQLFDWCGEKSVVVFQNIYEQPELWHCIEYDQRTVVTFDLYYCGIVFFDRKCSPQNYIVNF